LSEPKFVEGDDFRTIVYRIFLLDNLPDKLPLKLRVILHRSTLYTFFVLYSIDYQLGI